jgi:hypothetical protein
MINSFGNNMSFMGHYDCYNNLQIVKVVIFKKFNVMAFI